MKQNTKRQQHQQKIRRHQPQQQRQQQKYNNAIYRAWSYELTTNVKDMAYDEEVEQPKESNVVVARKMQDYLSRQIASTDPKLLLKEDGNDLAHRSTKYRSMSIM